MANTCFRIAGDVYSGAKSAAELEEYFTVIPPASAQSHLHLMTDEQLTALGVFLRAKGRGAFFRLHWMADEVQRRLDMAGGDEAAEKRLEQLSTMLSDYKHSLQ